MKHLKITAVFMSVAISLSFFVTTAFAATDETAPSESQTSGSETSETETPRTERFTVEKKKTSRTVSGMCGDRASWLLDDSGTLTVSGFGDMNSWASADLVPWGNYKDSIFAVVISSGVTSVGERAFEGCKELESVNIAQSVTKIGDNAFAGCTGLKKAVLDENLYKNNPEVFSDCTGIEVSYIASYPVIVYGGTADVSKASAGTIVTLKAYDAPDGKVFDSWTVNSVEVVITAGEDGTATFVMPDSYVELMAAYREKEPQNNTLKVRGKSTKLRAKKLKKKSQKISRSKVMSVSNAQGRVTYKLLSVSRSKYKKYFKVNARNGSVTVKKKLKKGTYTVRCRVTASGNNEYKSVSKTVTFKITVR